MKVRFVDFLVSALGYLINFFAGSNMVLLMVGAVFTGAGTIPVSMLISLVIIECADFNEWKGIPRMEGTMSSINNFGGKVGAALGTGALGVLLSLAGYTGSAENMSDSVVTMIRMLYSLVPMVLYVLTAFSLKLYTLDKIMSQIKADNEARRAAAGNVQSDIQE